MKLIKTIRIKLNAEATMLLPTFINYTNAFNYISAIGFAKKIYNAIELHKITYQDVRSNFNLPSQLTCSARNKSSEALKGIVKRERKFTICPKSKLSSIRLDRNSFTIFLDKKQVSILTCSGRLKFNLILSNYHSKYFQDWKYSSADLVIKNKRVFLNVVFEKDIVDTTSNGTFVGLDRGISNLAVTSNNKFYSGKLTKHISQKYRNLRRRLQKANTKSAKRHLKRLSGKEKRFKADINHQISKKIIDNLNPGDTLVLENLTGIRNKRLRKTIRILVNNWSFYQLEQFLTYKANAKGVCIAHVVAKYTSQTCSKCGFCAKNNRKTQACFACQACGFKLNADLNASRNISMKASVGYKPTDEAVINQPIVATEMLVTSHRPCAGGN